MLGEFRTFIARGNVMDMAVGIIIGAAFTAIVTSLVEDLINPLIGLFTGGVDLSGLGVTIGSGEDAAVFAYGSFIMAVINFLIVAWVVFLLVKAVNRAKDMFAEEKEPEPEAAPEPTEKDILIEIRDALQARG
ncbi:large-conductance mechanosensitive channel protein MscL [Tropicimonas sp. IMCC6043]|uniref:large-conductance mechanosensitive channel protein MscL n=1 Tax=Tropicimonas sp. IMCC6043 TaxID=2510645 RepID=UPI00101CE27E|nr:large-conductance mechanosensitive channel protein MscL [Tropicimonas sp. IMCC6043]RYH08691.1 large-conductance mechanosensitive channel protein MscL [Tropicimonas sp. IMCC6043]